MGKIILGVYGIAILAYCVQTLVSRRNEIESRADWFFAIVLPVACSAGTFGYIFDPGKVWAWIYLPLWILGFAGAGWELKDVGKLESGYTVTNIILAVVALAVIFGLGLLFGILWIVGALRG